MPTISAVPFTTVPAVRILINWADTPGATNAAVFRVDCETGEEVQLRPYVAYNADGYILLSCGQAVIWDTEIPFDRCVRYCTRAQTAAGLSVNAGAVPIYSDDFNRTVVDQWGTSNSGHTYQFLGGSVPNDWDVNGSQGTITLTTNNIPRESIVLGLSEPNGILYGFYQHPVVPTGATHELGIRVRRIDSNNFLDIRLFFQAANNIAAAIRQVIGGVESNVVFASPGVVNSSGQLVAANTPLNYRIDYWGPVMRAKVWPAGDPEPTTYLMATTVVGTASAGSLSWAVFTGGASTNPLPILPAFDNHLLFDPCQTPTPVQSCSTDLMVGSSGWSMLRDPMRPCNDLHVGICWTPDPNCVPSQGVFFQRLEGEGYAGNSVELRPFNSPRPASASRERSDAASALVLVTRTFADRDAMLEILRAGTPLLWQAPPEYGQPDRYIQIGDVNVSRYNPDHRYQPRTFTLPFLTEDRPEGPTQGICGTRVKDMCDTYTSWNAMQTAGLSYQDLLLGFASPSGPPDPNRRHWIDVENGFANWLAVETAPNTWKTLRDGE